MKTLLTILLMGCSIWASAKHDWPKWYQLANQHYQDKQFDSAYTYYFKLTHTNQKENTPDSILAESHRKLGIILYQQEQYDKSIENFKKASEHFNIINDSKNEYKSWLNLANVYVKLEHYGLAENLYQQCLQEATNNNNKAAQLSAHINLGGLYHFTDQYNLATKHLLQAQPLATDLKDTMRINMILNNLSTIFLNQNISDSALLYLKKSLSLSNDLLHKKAALWNLEELHYQLGNFDSAYFYKEQHNIVADSLKNGEIAITIARLETELQLEKDRAKFSSLMNWIIALVALLTLLALGLVFVLKVRSLERRNTNKRINELQTLSKMFIEQLKAHENEKTEVGSVVHSSILPNLVAAKHQLYAGNYEKIMELLEESTLELSDLKNNQLYTRRFTQSDWFRHTPTNAKNNYEWIETIGSVDPKVFSFEYKVATLSILEQLLQDGQQKITLFPDKYGVEIRFVNPIPHSKTTQTLLSFFDCVVQPNKIHIPLHEHQL